MTLLFYVPPSTRERTILATSIRPVQAVSSRTGNIFKTGILELEQVLLEEEGTPRASYYSYDIYFQAEEGQRFRIENWHTEQDNTFQPVSPRALERFQALCEDVYRRGLQLCGMLPPKGSELYISMEQWSF